MVVISRSSLNSNQFGVMYGNCDGLKSPNSAPSINRPLSPTFFHESQSPQHGRTGRLKNGFGKMAQKTAGPMTWMLRFAAVGTCFLLYNTFSELQLRKEELTQLQSDFNGLTESLIGTERELKSSHKNFFGLKMRLNAMKLQQGTLDESDEFRVDSELSVEERSKLSDSIISRQEALTSRVLGLQKVIGILHAKKAIQRFGEGPSYNVEFEVIIEGKRYFILIETAPITLMPHAVYTFLNAVNDGLWNDSVFLHRTSHIVQSAPIDSNGNDKRDLFQFENHLAFPEYSSEYDEHEKYTLGFSGRPGGPEFYINTSDNGKYHGPGGQNHHALSEEADPCFAKVIRGFDVIEKMEALNMKATSIEAGFEPLFSVIKSVKIIRPKSTREEKVTNQKAPQSQ